MINIRITTPKPDSRSGHFSPHMSHSLKRMNHEPTRHSAHANSSLLDLVLTSNPEAVKEVYNFKPGISDHDGVAFKLICKDIDEKPQFAIIRDYSRVTAGNIVPKLYENENLQTLFGDTDPDLIAHKLNEGLNSIAKESITVKIIQLKYPKKEYDDPELKSMRTAINNQNRIANSTKNQEEYRLLKNMKNIYSRREKAKIKVNEKKTLTNIKSRWKFMKTDEEEKIPITIIENHITERNCRGIFKPY